MGLALVAGRHVLQDDSGREIGERVARFLAEVEGDRHEHAVNRR